MTGHTAPPLPRVAILDTPDGPAVAIMAAGSRTWVGADDVWHVSHCGITVVRDLALIDPENGDQIDALLLTYPVTLDNTRESLRVALRAVANPAPPVPEPTGLGAVVALTDGTRAVNVRVDGDVQHWRATGDLERWRSWDELTIIGVTDVLSDGVEP